MFNLIIFILAMNFIGQQINALKCYQGVSNMTSDDLTATLSNCQPMASSCAASTDLSRRTILRTCMSTNCSIDYGKTISYSPICINSTGSPSNTFCCCYGDGCNLYANFTNDPVGIVPTICTGVWENWSEWSKCRSGPIFMQSIDRRMRFRQCLIKPKGCTPNGPIICNGNHWEQSPCIGILPIIPALITSPQNGI